VVVGIVTGVLGLVTGVLGVVTGVLAEGVVESVPEVGDVTSLPEEGAIGLPPEVGSLPIVGAAVGTVAGFVGFAFLPQAAILKTVIIARSRARVLFIMQSSFRHYDLVKGKYIIYHITKECKESIKWGLPSL